MTAVTGASPDTPHSTSAAAPAVGAPPRNGRISVSLSPDELAALRAILDHVQHEST